MTVNLQLTLQGDGSHSQDKTGAVSEATQQTNGSQNGSSKKLIKWYLLNSYFNV